MRFVVNIGMLKELGSFGVRFVIQYKNIEINRSIKRNIQ